MGKRRILKKAITSAALLALCISGTIAFAASSDSSSGTVASTYVSEDNYYDPDEWTDENGKVTPAYEAYPSTEYSGYWTKLSDTEWMYTFYVYIDTSSFYVWEDEVEGYTGDYVLLNPYYLEDGSSEAAVITNVDDSNPDYGSLSITKYVKYSDGTDYDSSGSFTILVTITDSDGEALSGTDVFGDYAFNNGIAYITIADGETIVLDNIPEGYLYSVEEIYSGEYSVSYTNSSGTITADDDDGNITTAEVEILNTPPTYMNVYTDITLAKEVTGSYEDDSAVYTFYISLSDLELDTEYFLGFYEDGSTITAEEGNVSSFTSSSSGAATITVYLKAGQSVVIKELPIGASYLVTEAAGDYTASYTITDDQDLGLINTTAAENTDTNKSLSTNTETVDLDYDVFEEVTITFTNALEKTQDIALTKVSVDENGDEEDDDTEYEITVTFSGLASGAYIISDAGRLTADTDGEIEVTVLITAGETIMFYDVPVGVTYQFTEEANDRIASYTVTDSEGLDEIESGSGSNSDANTDLSTAEETVNEGEEITVTFTNKYNETQDIVLAKETYYSDGSVDKADNTEYEFTVVFTGLEENVTYTYDKKTFTSDDNGEATVVVTLKGWESVTFEALPLGATYTVTETANSHIAAYTVEDANDTEDIASASGSNESVNTDLSTATETVIKGEEVTITFMNTASYASLQVRKVDSSGNSLGGAVFDLYLYNEDGDDTLIQSDITTNDDETSDDYGWSEVIEGLSAGTYYFVETEAPDGYFLSDGTITGLSSKYFTITADDYGTTVEVTIADSLLTILASTGGIGIYAIIFASIAAMIAAILIIIKKKDRRRA